MAKRQSFESRMLDWVDTSSLSVINTILPIMSARAKVRNLAEGAKVAQGTPIRRRKAKKTNAMGKATDFPTDTAVV